MTPEEAADHVVRTDPRFEVIETEIRGERFRVFRTAPRNLREVLDGSAGLYESRDLLFYEGERWDYPAFKREIDQLADALTSALGVRAKDRVAIAMRNFPEFPILTLAIASIGAIVVPMNAWLTEDELAYAFEDSGAKIVFADGPRLKRIRAFSERLKINLVAVRDAEPDRGDARSYSALRASAGSAPAPVVPIDPDDDFAVMYSSGSTGAPKGVVMTHRGVISTLWSWLCARAAAPLVDGAPEPPENPGQGCVFVATPLFHVTAMHASFLQSLALGEKIVLTFKWDADQAVRIVRDEGVTRFVGVPTQSAELMESARRLGEPLDGLENIGAGGAKRPAAQVGELAEAFPNAVPATGWGMTETNALGITLTGADYVAHPEAAGRVTPPVQDIRIVDDAGGEVAPGSVGELEVRSAANMRCYLNKPEATAETLRGGWLRTGDLARIDENGLVYIVDRKKSIIIRGGENISCLEVEGALHRHEDVLEACAFPAPDDRLGEIVGAAIYLRPGATVSEAGLSEFLSGHLARYKIPERFWLRFEPLPRGATDKLDRRGLRAECLGPAKASAAPRETA